MSFLNRKSSLGGDIVKLSFSKVGISVIALVTGMLLSRFRTLEEYGTYSQMTLVINLLSTVIMLGLPNSLNYFLAKADNNKERQEFLSVYYSLSTLLSIIVGAILVAATPLLVLYFNNPLIESFWYYLALYPWTRVICSGIGNILIVYKRSNGVVTFRIANSIAILGTILFVQLMNWGFTAYMILYICVEIIFTIIVYVIAYRLANGIKFSLKWSLIKKILIFSIPMGLASMIGTLNIEIDKLMIGNLMSTEQLAIYTNASREMPITMVSTSITAVLTPQMVRFLKHDKNEEAVALWGESIKLSFLFIGFAVAVLMFFAPEVITVLYSEKYLPGVSVFRVYSLALLFRFTYWGMISNAKGKSKFILYSSIAALVLNAALNYLFFSFWGIVGPAIATLTSHFASSAALLVFSSKLLNVKIRNIFPWRFIARTCAVQGALGAVMYALKEIIPADKLFANSFNLDVYNAKAFEAIIFGVLWTAIFFIVERKNIKKHWNALNKKGEKADVMDS